MVRHSIVAIVAIVAMLALLATPAEARRPAASFSYCGFGTGAASSAMEPGGGGDTLQIDDPEGVYHFVFDSSSPVTLAKHDRVLFIQIAPADVALTRVGDSLAVCVADRQYELFFEGHYCRSDVLSVTDTENHEIEEITFIGAREIWLSDVLFAARAKSPGSFPPADSADYASLAASNWRVRPFSEVMPDYAKPTIGCPVP